MDVDIDETLIAEVDRELPQHENERPHPHQRDENYRQGTLIRDNVAVGMWNVYEI